MELDIDIHDVFQYSPLLVDKIAIPASESEIDKVVDQLIKKEEFLITSKEQVTSKIIFLLACNSDEREKYFLDLENRTNRLFLFQEAYYNWYMSDPTSSSLSACDWWWG